MTESIFTELDKGPQGKHTARKPMISSLRRNLQRELVDRLIDLAQPDDMAASASKTISNLALTHLRQLQEEDQEGPGDGAGQRWIRTRSRTWKTPRSASPRLWTLRSSSTPRVLAAAAVGSSSSTTSAASSATSPDALAARCAGGIRAMVSS